MPSTLFDNHKKLHTSQTCAEHKVRPISFYNHIKLHTSQTMSTLFLIVILLWDHIKLHISQTRCRAGNPAVRFTTICLSNMPLNFLSSFEACLPYKITYFSNLHHDFLLDQTACLPYKITYFSNRKIGDEMLFDNHKKLHTSQTAVCYCRLAS